MPTLPQQQRLKVMLRSPSNWMVEIIFSLIIFSFILAVSWESFCQSHGDTLTFRSNAIPVPVPVPVPSPKETTAHNTTTEDRWTVMELRMRRLEKSLVQKNTAPASQDQSRQHVAPLLATPNPIPGFTPESAESPSSKVQPSTSDNTLSQNHKGYFVAVGCYANHEFARNYRQKLVNDGFPAYQKTTHRQDEILMCVFVGPLASEMDAKDTAIILEQNHGAIGPLVYPYPSKNY